MQHSQLLQNEDVHGYTMSLTIDELRWLHLSQSMDLLPTVRSNKYVFLCAVLILRPVSLRGRAPRGGYFSTRNLSHPSLTTLMTLQVRVIGTISYLTAQMSHFISVAPR